MLLVIRLCLTPFLSHKKSLLYMYSWMQNKIPSQFVCGSSGACLEYVLPGVQVTAGLGFFLRSSHLGQSILSIVIPYFNRPTAFPVGL